MLIFSAVQVHSDVQAAGLQPHVRPYVEARFGAGGVSHSDLNFYPRFGSFSAGAFVFNHIGVEAFVDTSLSAGDRGVFELSVNDAKGLALRFQSPAQRGLQAYILLGYVNFSLEQKENGVVGQRSVKQSFDGARVSIGIQQQLKIVQGLIFGVEYRNYYANSGITVDGLSLGLRYELP